MKAIGNNIGIIFDETHLKTYDLGTVKLQRAETWIGKEGDEEDNTKTQSNVNHLETNPQIGWVAMSNDKYNLQEGDKVFMHYLAYEEYEEKVEIEGKEIYLVNENYIFFKMKDSYVMRLNTYLGRVITEEPPKTSSGIFLTAEEAVKNQMRIVITHVPIPSENEYGIVIPNVCELGDEIIPIDSSNYPIKVDGEAYVLLKDTEIVGKYATETEA